MKNKNMEAQSENPDSDIKMMVCGLRGRSF